MNWATKSLLAGGAAAGMAGAAWRGMGAAGRRTAIGAGVGAGWGMASGDTSVIGGALMGAGGARYLGAGFKRAALSGRGMGFGGSLRAYGSAFGRGVVNRARLDFRGTRVMANKSINKVQSTLKGWR